MRWSVRRRVALVRCLIIPVGATCLLWDLLRGTWYWLLEFPECVRDAAEDNLNTVRLVFSEDLVKYNEKLETAKKE